ncbi:MAG TPA: type II toxin-antitoxin system HicA family toxin [Bacteroidetes bacterium]|nr:type II toxin-antitoxin system HicA family toxin [Bacteroidota bacterium]HRK05901.1 type II toxin-antitoxin system HicA family toxin [Chlorobiota bacterium]
MTRRHIRTLHDVFVVPTKSSIVFSDIESLIVFLGGSVTHRSGSRVRFELRGEVLYCHRPHPGKDAKRYQVEDVRSLLIKLGIVP